MQGLYDTALQTTVDKLKFDFIPFVAFNLYHIAVCLGAFFLVMHLTTRNEKYLEKIIKLVVLWLIVEGVAVSI